MVPHRGRLRPAVEGRRAPGCNPNDAYPEAHPPLVMFAGVRPDAAPVMPEISRPAPAARRDARVGKAA